MKRLYILFISILVTTTVWGKQITEPNADSVRLAGVWAKLHTAAVADTAYLSSIDISADGIPLSDLIHTIATVSGVNISVKGVDNVKVKCNFTNTNITHIIYFLCKEYDLDIDVIGKIISIFPAKQAPAKTRDPEIIYQVSNNSVSYDFNGDKLIDVVKQLVLLTGQNIILPKSLYTKQVYGFVDNMPYNDAIQTMAMVNGLEIEQTKKGIWSIIEGIMPTDGNNKSAMQQAFVPRRKFTSSQLTVDSTKMITAQIGKGNVQDIIANLCEEMDLNYFFASPINQQTAVYVKNVNFETLLGVLFCGTTYSFYQENGIYIFGTSGKDVSLSYVKTIPMTYRSVDKLVDIIPTSIKAGLEIKPFPDLNSLIVSGDIKQLQRVETFLQSIDKSVPLVTIEIIIADVSKSNIQEAGINMGLGKTPTQTSGTLSPGINMNLNANSVNKLINSFNGFGSINLGKVSPEFYMSLKFLEDNGTIELRSTPKLSTLNGHEATLKSGETKYYKEVMNNFIGTQNPIQSESYTWKSVEANLAIKITPYVSLNNHITLDIEIEQTEFTAREEKEAPPGTATRSFKSLIKVQNEDMVLLGGIDRNSREKSSSGLPFIARVPVLKWFFGHTKNNKEEHKLNVFIKPTVIE